MTESPKSSKTPKRNGSWWRKNWFYTVLIAVALLGGLGAFWIPFRLPQPFSKGDSISTLRQSILAATGGVLAILTLGENRRKNIQEKEKNDQDHTRQVHAERRARYAKAIEQLADAKAPVRLGGVYTLIKLVDEWLADEKTLPNEEERREEGQVIINSLCAYIRSPFDLASKTEELSEHKVPENYEGGNQQFIKDQARFREEKELRLTILEAVRNRLNKGTRVHKNGTQKLLPGQWSGFDYDFSNTVFFYPVGFNNSYFGASSNFSGAEFTGNADFSKAKFAGNADFSKAKFAGNADFSKAKFTDAHFFEAEFTDAHFFEAKFTGYANFFEAKFTGNADFSKAKFTGYAHFFEAKFTGNADFSKAEFTGYANFFEAKFTGNANFFEAEFTDADFFEAKFTGHANFFEAEFTGYANFSMAKFTDANFSKAEFTGYANFSKAEFTGSANFSWAKFTKDTDFSEAEFTGYADFSWAKFTKASFSRAKFTEDTDFSGVEFTGDANFSGATFEEKPIFERALGDKTYKARFSYKADPEDYNFEVSHHSPYKIETEEQEHNGIKFTIPKGAELFDPDKPSEQEDNDDS